MFVSLLIIQGSYQKLYAPSYDTYCSEILLTSYYTAGSVISSLKPEIQVQGMHAHQILPTNHCNKMADNDVPFCQHTVTEFLTKEDN